MTAIITGASKGIGKAIATKCIEEGMHLAICARNKEDLEAATAELQAINKELCILAMVADLSKKEEVIRFAEGVLDTFAHIDILVNNAGTFLPGDISSEEEGRLEFLMETNLYSAYHLTRALLPRMLAQKKGHIFNVSSVAGLQAYPHGGSYSISKFALQGFSKNLREELKDKGIKVTTINPGATMSDSWNGSGIEPTRIMQGSDIANALWAAYTLSEQAVIEDLVLRPQLGDL